MTHLAACKPSIDIQAFAKLSRLHGLPYEFVSDSRFTSNFMREVCRLFNVKQAMSAAFHPQTDGQTERVSRTLENICGSM